MSQMLQLIKSNAVPAAVMRSAAKGGLSLPAAEMLQILVHLTSNPVFGQEAAFTLAQWDAASLTEVLSSSDPPQEILDYFLDAKNRRPALMPALIENPRVSEQKLTEIATTASRELLTLLLASARIKGTPNVLQAAQKNPHLAEPEAQQLRPEMEPASTEEPADP